MNEIPHVYKVRPTTQVADGVSRRRWTSAEFERLAEVGFFTEDDRIELIGGELVPMSPKGDADEANYFEPDLLFGPADLNRTSINPTDVLLVIEIAHSSLAFDTTTKASQYAGLRVREYWVIDAITLAARVDGEPAAAGYGKVNVVAASEQLAALLMPSLALSSPTSDRVMTHAPSLPPRTG